MKELQIESSEYTINRQVIYHLKTDRIVTVVVFVVDCVMYFTVLIVFIRNHIQSLKQCLAS